LQNGWEQMSFLSDAENAFTFERAWVAHEIQKARASHQGYEQTFGMIAGMRGSGSSSSGGWGWPPDWETITEKPRYAAGEVMWRSSWSYSTELRSMQANQIILETLRTMKTNQSQFYKADYDAMASRLSALGLTNAGQAYFRALKIPDMSEFFGGLGWSSALRKTLRMEAAGRVVVAAIALKRFQLQHGKLPATLGEVAPEILAAAPIDPYDGKPLRYHPNADGTFLLYCVGDDGVDDGGDPSLSPSAMSATFYWQNDKARDWVWPQPATDAEIKYFYEHPPK
jgi:hypothetical protein